ncbi:head protein [Leminorella grimontii]|uniref:Head protein n=1 Tax=Leminorella grimontii TaxID=82981 RepID=A0AAV5N912_9GAMM|nr:Mu-like prophage major head subunit gpT family protein [Leminorella grimontii]KFC92454.1 phage major capsid protein [Leminorella grimontii ATCC 33999 = DSM 5078]GKX57619.1 head protein [Leminorella grimontii]VFS55837.1 Mu-like prophage major head subunit gpT [Leminorella grimontii]
MEISQAALAALYTAVNTAFNTGRGNYTPLHERIATIVPSTSGSENYAWLGEFTRLKEWVGERDVKEMSISDYTVKNVKYEATEGILAEYIEDDTYGVLMPKFEDMGYAAASHPDELVFQLLANGFTQPCYDKQNFFDTDHPVGEKMVSNMQAGEGSAWYLLDTSRPLKPLLFQKRRDYRLQAKTDPASSDKVFMTDNFLYGVDARVAAGYGFWQQAFASKAELNEDNLNAAITAMMLLESSQGRPLGIVPNLLVVGPQNRAAAKRVVEAENKAGGESNINYKAVEIVVVPWLR